MEPCRIVNKALINNTFVDNMYTEMLINIIVTYVNFEILVITVSSKKYSRLEDIQLVKQFFYDNNVFRFAQLNYSSSSKSEVFL